MNRKAFNGEFCRRTRAWRKTTGMTMQQMADAIGMTYEAYRTYELLRPLPHYLIVSFAAVTGASIPALFTGHPPPPARRSNRER